MSKKNKKDYTMYENTEPKCPHFGFCGGCTFQKITYDRQLEIKADEVKSLIDGVYGSKLCTLGESATGGCGNSGDSTVKCSGMSGNNEGTTQMNGTKLNDGYVFEGILPSPLTEGYRNKMEFTFGDEYKDGPFALGLHQKGSFMNIVNITDCCLIHPDLNKIRNLIRDYFNEYFERGEITFHNNKTHKGWLRHLLVRRASKTGEILVALVTNSEINSGISNDCFDRLTLAGGDSGVDNDKHEGADRSYAYAGISYGTGLSDGTEGSCIKKTDLVCSINEGEPAVLLNENIVLETLIEKILNLKLEGTLTGFVHITNDSYADAVKADRIDVLYGRDYIFEQVLNLKFKISVFSFFQTNTLGAEVLYTKAREYASDAHGLLFDLYSGTGTIAQLMAPAVDKVVGVEIVAEAVEAAKENARLNGIENAEFIAADVLKAVDVIGKPDSLILDPPREGINPKALGKILSWGVDSVVYVSCKPTSLARDLEYFKIAGYKLVKACCVDMFPGTEHVEVVSLLSRTEGTTREA